MVGPNELLMLMGLVWGALAGASFGGSHGWLFGIVGFFVGGIAGLFYAGFGWLTLEVIADRSALAYRSRHHVIGSLWLVLYLSTGLVILYVALLATKLSLT